MIIRFSSRFKRAYRKLSEEQRIGVDAAIYLFVQNPFDPRLRNHKLSGQKKGIRSISAAYDLRLLYIEKGQSVALMLMVGTHDEVY